MASLRLRDCRWCSAQVSRRDWPGIAGLLQFLHLPRNSDGNPDSPQVVVFLATIIYVTVGS